MNTQAILTLFDQQERYQNRHPSYRREEALGIVRHISRDPSRLSFIIYSDLTAVTADQAIQEQIAYFKALGGPGVEWKMYDHDNPPDLKKRLQAHGFQPDEAEALLLMDLAQTPAVFLEPVTADVRRITQPEQVRDVVMIQESVWGGKFDWLEEQLVNSLQKQPDYWSIYIAYVDDAPACAAWSYFPKNSQFASLWGGSTVEKYRQMGLYTAVVATRIQEARLRGYDYIMVDASEMSHPILEKRGFQFLTYTYPYTWSANPPETE